MIFQITSEWRSVVASKRHESNGAERRAAARRGARLCRENPRSGTGLKRAGSLLEE
jgi:hypothetical protein